MKDSETEAVTRLEGEKRKLETIIDSIGDGVCILSTDFKILYENKALKAMFGEHKGEYCYMEYHNRDEVCEGCPVAESFTDGKIHTMERTMLTEKGTLYLENTASLLRDPTGKIIAGIEVVRDITDRKRVERALKEKEKNLEYQAQRLEKVNTALQVLLDHREGEKKKLEENVLITLRKLVLPYVEKLEKGNLDGDSQTYVSIIKSNLADFLSPFLSTLSSRYSDLTPTEVEVAELIRQGKTSKDIASLLNVSCDTVSFHRSNIRKKLGLSHKKMNLRSYLLSLTS